MKRNSVYKLALVSLVAATVSGCANNPDLQKSEKITMENADSIVQNKAKELEETWSKNDPAITYVDREESIYVERTNEIPDDILSKNITNLIVKPGSTLSNLTGFLYPYGIHLMFDDKGSGESERKIEDLRFSVRNFNGTVGNLLGVIQKLHNVSFEYLGDGAIKVSEKTRYIASIPQNEYVQEAISEGVEALGASEIKTNKLSGSLIYSASYSEQEEINSFFDRFYSNYAGVKMQITVFNVSLEENLSDGFNWSELDFVLGSVEAAYSGQYIDQMLSGLQGNNTGGGTNTPNPGTGGGGNNNGNDNGDNNNENNQNGPDLGYNSRYDGSSIDDLKSFGWLNSDGLEVGAFNDNVSLSVVMDWLNQYGSTRAEQSAFLETITGKETIITSQKLIPVITDESTTLVGNLSPVATQNTDTDEKEIGLKVEFTPYYESSSQEMTIDLNLELKNLVGQTTLKTATGNTIQRPEIQQQEFPTTVRMKVGETKLLGGVVFDSLIETRNDINMFSKDEGYINQRLSKSAMFILIRPSVQLFRDVKVEKQ
jgi:hypothetical protein